MLWIGSNLLWFHLASDWSQNIKDYRKFFRCLWFYDINCVILISITGKANKREKKRGSTRTEKENRKARKPTTSCCKQTFWTNGSFQKWSWINKMRALACWSFYDLYAKYMYLTTKLSFNSYIIICSKV